MYLSTNEFRISRVLLRATLAFACTGVLAAASHAASADHWVAIPGLDEQARNEVVRDFHARGTRHGLTLLVAGPSELTALQARFERAIDLGAFRDTERLFFVFSRATHRLPEGARVLYEKGEVSLVAITPGTDPHALHGDGPSRFFHDGITPVPARRQRPQPTEWSMKERRAQSLLADPLIQSWVDQVSRTNLESDVTFLSTEFSTRASNTGEGVEAQNWIFDRFTSIGLSPTLHSFGGGADNVIAEITGVVDPGRVVIIGAHYDSINLGFFGDAPGADDNASGTSAVLEIARILADANAQFRYTLRFILFASEEVGLVGSNAYSGMLQNQGVDVIAMLNTDMNAYRANGDTLDLDFVNNDTTPSLTQMLRDISADYVPDLPTRTGNLFAGSSDHASFFNDGFPAAFYFEDTGSFSPNIHTSNDQVGNSANDFELSEKITMSILAGASVLAEPTGALDPPVLSISGGCPGLTTFSISDATANSSVALITGPNAGSATVPGGVCIGAPLDVNSPTLRQVLSTDGAGNATFEVNVPSGGCGSVAQVLDLGSCLGSDVVAIP